MGFDGEDTKQISIALLGLLRGCLKCQAFDHSDSLKPLKETRTEHKIADSCDSPFFLLCLPYYPNPLEYPWG